MNQEQFWKIRSEKYNKLEWVNEGSYIEAIILSGDFGDEDLVLDVGTGTGVIAHSLAPLVKEVIGMDISQDMLDHSNWKDNKYFIKRDVREPIFHHEVFDKITARMVFHHIMDDTQGAMDECYRILKKGGKMILAEGVPPSPEVKKDYEEIFSLKEDRLTFLEEDMIALMDNSGFREIVVFTYTMKDFSVKNWLANSGLSNEIQCRIFEMHVNGSEQFKEVYNMKVNNGDCFIDTKSLIVVGEK